MNLRLASIILFVNDVSSLERFYMEILQLERIESIAGEWSLLSAGSMTIGLHKIGGDPDVAPHANIVYHSNTKVVFEVEEDIQALRAALISRDVKLKEVVTWDNYDYWLCDGEDPEGNVFQLRQKK